MACRAGGAATQRSKTDAIKVNGDVPPSTIAAQIVHNHANTNARQEPESKAFFGQLLQEYLKDPVAEETSVETNAKLVAVVAEAGLDVLLKNNLFAQELLIPQANDSLRVIHLTLHRNPQLIFYRGAGSDDNVQQPPLVLWLLPKLFALLGRQHLAPLTSSIKNLLSICVSCVSKTLGLWQDALLLLRMFKACIDDILSTVKSWPSSHGTESASFRVSLPPFRSIEDVWSDASRQVAIPLNCQVAITSLHQAAIVALNLLDVINEATTCADMSALGKLHISYRAWALDCCAQLLPVFLLKKVRLDGLVDHDAVLSVLCRTACSISLPNPGSKHSRRGSKYQMLPLLQVVVSLLNDSCLSTSLRLQVELSHVLLTILQTSEEFIQLSKAFNEHVVPVIAALVKDDTRFSILAIDLQLTLRLTDLVTDPPLEIRTDPALPPQHVRTINEGLASVDDGLREAFQRLYVEIRPDRSDGVERPRKRQKIESGLSEDERGQAYQRALLEILRSFGVDVRAGMDTLQELSVDRYVSLSENDRWAALVAISKLPCVGCQQSVKSVNSVQSSDVVCDVCDYLSSTFPSTITGPYLKHERQLLSFLEQLFESQQFQRSKKSRILAAVAVRKIFNHVTDPQLLDIVVAPLGQWCLRSLHSSIRELRIAAGSALTAFIRDALPEEVRNKNRSIALNYLKMLSEKEDLGCQETSIYAWGQLARICGDGELNIALLQLVEYLGHSHPMLSGAAYTELSRLLEVLHRTPDELFKPFWRSIAITVVKDLHTRPQKVQQLSDFLGMSVNQFLLLTQTETLPYLVLMKRANVLQRIAAARGATVTVENVCTQPPANLAAIVSLLLAQKSPDLETTTMDLLCTVAPGFRQNDLSYWITLEPILIACEMLKAAADQEADRKAQIHQGIQFLAVLAGRKPGQSRAASKPNRLLASFFETNVLGIMALLSDIVDNPTQQQPLMERIRAVKAVEEMINIGKAHVNVALPQIRACLQSAMHQQGLRDHAFSAWAALMVALEEEDVDMLLEHTFALIVTNWSQFTADSHQKAYDTIAQLIKAHSALVRERIGTLPSLAPIPLLSKFESEIARLKEHMDTSSHYEAFSQRCADENADVVLQALRELLPFLEANQRFIHESAVGQQPNPVIARITRSLLDIPSRFNEGYQDTIDLCCQCLGLVGCLDPNRVEAPREKRSILMLSNFERASEVVDFVAVLLETVLVKAFRSATNGRAQNFLAYVMQELLKFCGFPQIATYRPRASQPNANYQRWMEIPESIRSTLAPYLTSRYLVRSNVSITPPSQTYPIFKRSMAHGTWLRAFVFDLLQRGKGENAQMVFPVLARVARGHDLSIATFMLPFAVLNIVLGGIDDEVEDVRRELLTVLNQDFNDDKQTEADNLRLCSENVFQILDYLSRWLQEKKKVMADARAAGPRGNNVTELDELRDVSQISSVERVLSSIPAEVIAQRALECKSFARALFHWEQYIRQVQERPAGHGQKEDYKDLYQRLHDIYADINEPDGLQGIVSQLNILDPGQEARENEEAGRWAAAQSWYELSLAESPGDVGAQEDLLWCLKSTGRYESILHCFESLKNTGSFNASLLQFVVEASWVTGKWGMLEKISAETSESSQDFDLGVGNALLALHDNKQDEFRDTIASLRKATAKALTPSATTTLQTCHMTMLKLHALYEVEALSGMSVTLKPERSILLETLDRRLDALGAFTTDKQYLIGLRRATMQLSRLEFSKDDLAAAWLTSARLARKANLTDTAYNAVLHAAKLADDAAKIEHCRLLWKDGHHRKAIQSLEGAIAANVFQTHNTAATNAEEASMTEGALQQQNVLIARAHLLLAKWMDTAGQTQSGTIISRYQHAVRAHTRWDKGHYYLGKYYNKMLESEKLLPHGRQSQAFQCGEYARLVIENYTRSMGFGSKYYYQTVPKVLTLWLDFGTEVYNSQQRSASSQLTPLKARQLESIQKHLRKYIDRLPAYIFYTAFPQIITRISHPNPKVWELLSVLIVKVASAHLQQALWSLLAVQKASATDRSSRGLTVLNKLKDNGRRSKTEGATIELRALVTQGQRLSESLLHACEAPVDTRATHASLSRDLGFNHKLAPCALVVPIESTMTASLPAVQDSIHVRGNKAFLRNAVTISSFLDDVLVLTSLQRPRKLTVRGSDGLNYGLLCKPKDDLRKDQRLMEFNAMIDRALKKDVESSKRRLYIKTYGVTPLNEECGTIEWVDNLKPMRDIIIKLYRQRSIKIDYGELRQQLAEASADPRNLHIFTDVVLPSFPPVLYEWFIDTFPEPDAWFAARLRYARSCAVMSIVGHMLGLGDRHGENVLLEEGTGGVFHVDFNCLFDKGLTFEKPELVPFRLTHNMVDAFGAYGCEGPFRTAAELTLRILRQHEDTLMTILETFLYDPTTDFIGKKKRPTPGVPDTPQEVLDSVRSKLHGLIRGESVPLSVEGYVDALIQMARDPARLAAMYIGWCAFF